MKTIQKEIQNEPEKTKRPKLDAKLEKTDKKYRTKTDTKLAKRNMKWQNCKQNDKRDQTQTPNY